jgi:hypothetical protein
VVGIGAPAGALREHLARSAVFDRRLGDVYACSFGHRTPFGVSYSPSAATGSLVLAESARISITSASAIGGRWQDLPRCCSPPGPTRASDRSDGARIRRHRGGDCGGTSFERGNGWLPGTLLGVLTVGVLKNGLNVMEVHNALQVASIGLLVIVALLIDSIRGESIRGRA